MKIACFFAPLVALSVFCALPVKADLISNGSFETPDVGDGSYGVFTPGQMLGDWTVVGNPVAIVDTDFTSGAITFQSHSGRQWLDLTGTGTSQTSGVTQSIATTVGAQYDLSFYVGSTTNGVDLFASTVQLVIDGGTPLLFTNPTAPTNAMDWMNVTHRFTAQNASTSITFLNGSDSDNHNTGLDSVSFQSTVPEPGSLILFSVAAGVGLMVRRVRRR